MNAKEYAALAASISQTAVKIAPAENEPCSVALNMAVLNLRAVSRELQRIAEWKAQHDTKEGQQG